MQNLNIDLVPSQASLAAKEALTSATSQKKDSILDMLSCSCQPGDSNLQAQLIKSRSDNDVL